MPFRVLQDLTLHSDPPRANPKSFRPGDVLADLDVPVVLQRRVLGGDPRFRGLLEHVSEEQAAESGWTPERVRTRGKPPYPHTPPTQLRWAGAGPGDAEHAQELDRRVAALEEEVSHLHTKADRTP
jgi:hypothetical protein